MDDIVRNTALIEELHTSIGLAQLGLGSLQRIDGSNSFYHLPLQLLASGKERLLKVILSLHSMNDTGSYPTQRQMKQYGHNLAGLIDKVTEPTVFGKKWISTTTAGADDHAFLTQDQLYREMISILSHFGQYGRYANLDLVVGQTPTEKAPEMRWKKMEVNMLSSSDLSRMQQDPAEGYERARQKINEQIIITLERAQGSCSVVHVGRRNA